MLRCRGTLFYTIFMPGSNSKHIAVDECIKCHACLCVYATACLPAFLRACACAVYVYSEVLNLKVLFRLQILSSCLLGGTKLIT